MTTDPATAAADPTEGAPIWMRDVVVPEEPPDDVELPGEREDPADPALERARPGLRAAAEITAPAAVDDALVDGLVRRGQIVVVAGPEGLGKTSLLLELAIRGATGAGELVGHYAIQRPFRVAIFDEDNGEAELWRREQTVLAAIGLERSALGELYRTSFAGVKLTDRGCQAWVIGELERIRPDLVILDTGSAMVGDEWGSELKDAIRFLRSLTIRFGCTITVSVHLVKPARGGDARGRSAAHGTSLSDVMGQWTRQADVVAMMSDLGEGRCRWTVRKRVTPSSLILAQRDGIWEVVAVDEGEAQRPTTNDDRIMVAIAAGATGESEIRIALGTPDKPLPRRTFYDAVGRLRAAGYVAEGTPLALTGPGWEAVA